MNDLLHRYVDAKHRLGEQLGASEALLHLHAGLLVFVVAALLLRRRMASPWPIAIVIGLALANELVDWFGPSPAPLWRAAVDVLNTIVWPLVLFLVARRGRIASTKV